MRLLRRNTTAFEYRALTGEEEILKDGMHTGNMQPTYANPVQYRGNISAPSGFATDQLFGINTRYTHVLLMDNPDAPIAEDGLIDWKGATYEVKAVRPSLNVLAVALKKRTKNNAPVDSNTEQTTTEMPSSETPDTESQGSETPSTETQTQEPGGEEP